MQPSVLLSRWSAAVITVTCCAQMAFSQGQAPAAGGGGGTTGAGAGSTGSVGGGTGGGIGNAPGRSTTPNPFPSPGQTQQQQQPTLDMPRPIFFQGKVIMDDGTPPPEQVVIELVCSGSPRPQAYTNSKGHFSFQLGQNSQMMADASVSNAGGFGGNNGTGMGSRGGMSGMGTQRGGERDLNGCDLRAALPGYRSESINLSGRRSMENPDVGTIVLRRMANVEGLTFSATSAMAPKEAKKAYEKGRDLDKKKKPAEAQKEFEKAVAAYPKYANAWLELGKLQERQNEVSEARRSYAQAVISDSKLVEPYVHLAYLSAQDKNWPDCAAESEKALKLNPYDFTQAYFFNAVANLNMKNLDAAEKSARDGIKADPNKRYPKLRHILGIVLAQKNDVPGAMEHMKGYLAMIPENSADVSLVKGQLTQLEKFAQANSPKPAATDQQQQ